LPNAFKDSATAEQTAKQEADSEVIIQGFRCKIETGIFPVEIAEQENTK